MTTSLEVPVEISTAPNSGIPFAVLVDGRGVNKLALGLMRPDRLLTLRGEPADATHSYNLSIETRETIATRRYEDTFYVSRAPQGWFHEAQAYTRAVDNSRGYTPLRIPESAYDPTYDSWYFTGDAINQDLVWELAVLSHELGFKSYLLDAGWDTTPGDYSLWIEGSTGNYRPDTDYFPDFSGLLRRIRTQLGMKVMLWMQQYALGRRSIHYPDLKDALTYVLDPATAELDETMALCPRVSATRQHMVTLFQRILEDYQPDALWFDWQDYVPVECSAWHLHDNRSFGEGYNATQKTILRNLLERDPELFVEIRWPFANLNNKPYAHLWQPIDSPQDFHFMRLQAMNMRAFSSGVAIGTDEMYWRPELSDAEAARFMATVVFTGVPYFGPDLRQEPPSRREMLKAWLNFYLSNKSSLIGGTFEPYGDFNQPDQKIESPEATFIYCGRPYDGVVRLNTHSPRIYIVNASPSPGIDLRLSGLTPGPYSVEISDIHLNPMKTSVVFLRRDYRLQFDVQVGCLLTLTRANANRLPE
jgi:alpha-galactosidase